MEHEITSGAILIKDDAFLPKELYFESELCVSHWKVVTNLKSLALDREIQKTGWTFFCSTGETKASVFGIDHTKMARRAIEAILATKTSDSFNSLEILQMNFVGSERFPLVQYLTLSAQWRHIRLPVNLRPLHLAPTPDQLCQSNRCSTSKGTRLTAAAFVTGGENAA